jgi:hypothetical protein
MTFWDILVVDDDILGLNVLTHKGSCFCSTETIYRDLKAIDLEKSRVEMNDFSEQIQYVSVKVVERYRVHVRPSFPRSIYQSVQIGPWLSFLSKMRSHGQKPSQLHGYQGAQCSF